MRERRSLGAAVMVVGLGLVGLSQLMASAPTAPLFDGLVVEDPYRFVAPPPSGAPDPFAASAVELVVNGAVPLIAIATEETPPQAQMIAQEDAFVISDGTSSVAVSIDPDAPTDPRIAGNLYEFTVTDQAGTSLEIVPGALVTIVLRAPQPDPGAMIARLNGNQWVPLPTQHGGLPDLLAANIGQLGDFAVLISGGGPSPSGLTPSATVAAPSASPSRGSDGARSAVGIPIWVIVVFVTAAVGVGLTLGILRGRMDD